MSSAPDVAALQTAVTTLQSTVTALQASVASVESSHKRHLATDFTQDVNTWYLCIMGFLVFFMQAGFALLEAGSVRAKNTKNILMKNLLDACIGALIWWSWGYGIAYDMKSTPEQGFIGHGTGNPDNIGSFFTGGYNAADGGQMYAAWWFQYVFCAAAATIVSGAMAERTTLTGYLVYTICISGFIYPVVVYWSWSYGGWISPFHSGLASNPDASFNGGLMDFAGSGIVHMTGGIAALCGAAIVGPRKGRFDESKKPIAMPAHNTTFQVLGTMILWLGWYGFNPGSTLALAGYGQEIARSVCTTTLSAASGGITVVLLDKMALSKTWDVGMLCNGILAGLVSITAGANKLYPYAAMIAGIVGGFVYISASKIVLHVCKVDDPLDAFAVHGACGFWGVIAAALFAATEFGQSGCFVGDCAKLGAAFVFLLADIGWTGGWSAIMFGAMKAAGILRVSAEVEDAGMDVSKHGGTAYSS